MKILLVCILFTVFSAAKAGYDSNCEIEGVDPIDWLWGHTRQEPIDDTHRGLIASFKTHNITGVRVENPVYVDAVFKNEELKLFVTEKFNNFEVEIKGSYDPYITVKLSFDCTDKSDSLNMKVRVIDINNHLPVFNQEAYEYIFGIKIPAGFEITQLLPISASDIDFTNNKISFSFQSHNSEYFSLEPNGKTKYPDYGNYYTAIKTKKNITEYIREEFTIVSTDVGDPVSSSSAKLIIVVDPTMRKSKVHPPVFTKSLYYANYTRDHKFIMSESISLLYGGPNLILQQSDHTKYFEISYDDVRNEVDVMLKEPLPNGELAKRYLIIEIEARNEGVDIPGRTNLIINLPDVNSTTDKFVVQDVCDFSHVYVLSVIICLSVILIILVLSVWILSSHLKKQKLSIALSNRFQTESINEIKVPM